MRDSAQPAATVLVLSDDTPWRTELADWARRADQTQQVNWVSRQLAYHTRPAGRPSVVVLAGARAAFGPLEVLPDSRCLLTFGAGLPEISPDGLEVRLAFREAGRAPVIVWQDALPAFDNERPWRKVVVDLSGQAGKRGDLLIYCDPGPRNESAADWLAVYELVVSPAAELTLNRARAFPALRAANEIAHFSQTYTHALYEAPAEQAAVPSEPPAPDVYRYYTDRLLQRLELDCIDFASRLRARIAQQSGPVRVLSLASGAARIEEELLRGVDPERVALTLTDLNPDLLRIATERLESHARVDGRLLDLNRLELPAESFDVVLCVSALHHVVELEHVVDQIAATLVPGGEFWSIGEYVGRNGSRLFDDALQVADRFFRSLPETYRHNRNPGAAGEVDAALPNHDCSLTCFEGIRSEEIEAIVARRLQPVEVRRFDCFLWRLFNLAYLDNYDLSRAADRALVERAIDLEVEFFHGGGQPTTLNGVFCR
ncbi:MAG: class I SAM-dependent methyltransferase [Planctomycetes bacterium]|nr:class I SAM-dependent methyltransferase [Planctomycetota bacterium]MCB9869212.1 class I SAM-dependent methyltransferase [Planctomycetota bacterium]